VSEDDNIKFSPRIAHFLLPWFKEFHQEQMLEKSAESSIQGIIIIVVIIAVSVFR
jgi:[histone H3]-dimethyl-L-lysine9 demethylase